MKIQALPTIPPEDSTALTPHIPPPGGAVSTGPVHAGGIRSSSSPGGTSATLPRVRPLTRDDADPWTPRTYRELRGLTAADVGAWEADLRGADIPPEERERLREARERAELIEARRGTGPEVIRRGRRAG